MYKDLSVVLEWAVENGVEISTAQEEQLLTHKNMVLETNKNINLTAITDAKDFDIKHIIDSLTLLPFIEEDVTLADIGTGAGFPGIALAIMRPDISVTLIDSLQKRVRFLEDVVQALGLHNVECKHARAEELKNTAFDITTARAVASLDKLAKWILPITCGKFLAMKGSDVTDEIDKAKPAIKKYGGQLDDIYSVCFFGLERNIVSITLENAP